MENIKTMNLSEVINAALNVGIVKFWFTKIDGSKRIAIGTRNPHILELTGATPKGEGDRRESNPTLTCYYDFVKGSWRCFKNHLAGGLIFENMSNEQAAAEILAEGRENGEDELARAIAAKFVPMDMVGRMFTAIVSGGGCEAAIKVATEPAEEPSRAELRGKFAAIAETMAGERGNGPSRSQDPNRLRKMKILREMARLLNELAELEAGE